MRYIRLCIISLLATLPLAVHASPQPLEQIKQSESQLSGRVGMIEMDLASGRTLTAWRADERYFFGVFSDAHQDSDKLTRVALTRGMKKKFC